MRTPYNGPVIDMGGRFFGVGPDARLFEVHPNRRQLQPSDFPKKCPACGRKMTPSFVNRYTACPLGHALTFDQLAAGLPESATERRVLAKSQRMGV